MYPEVVQPSMAISHEDRRAEWVTNKNLNGWRDLATKELVKIGMLKDEPGEIRKFIFLLPFLLFLLVKLLTSLLQLE